MGSTVAILSIMSRSPISHVHFELENSRLAYWHDGRAFNLKDIESITNIGNSSKLEDVSSIGKFGIGFKAVFAYTDAPEIYSGEYSFRIRDLIALEKIESSILEKGDLRTLFVFPFGTKSFDQSVKVRVVMGSSLYFLV